MPEKLLTIREVSQILHLTEREVIDLTENGTIPAYKVGGVYLRYKKEQILEFSKKHFLENKHKLLPKLSLSSKVKDFLYFNDFYIICAILIATMLFLILKA